ncbi:MAG: hypothetical protein R2724_08550 [Bryobacterales bacterium]
MGLRTFERFESDGDSPSKISAMPASTSRPTPMRVVHPPSRAVDIFPRDSGGITVFGEDCSKQRH